MAAILALNEPEIAPFDPPTPKTLYHRTKHGEDRMTHCRDMAIQNIYHEWCIWNPHFGEGDRRGSLIVPFERAMMVSHRLSIVTIALYLTIRLQFTIEWLQSSNQQGQFGQNFGMFPLEYRSMMLGSVDSEHTMLTITVKIFLKVLGDAA